MVVAPDVGLWNPPGTGVDATTLTPRRASAKGQRAARVTSYPEVGMGQLPDTSPIGLDCPNGKRLQFDVTFSCSWENEVVIRNEDTGTELKKFNSHSDPQGHRGARGRTFIAEANASPIGGNTRFSIHGRHKHSEPAHNMPWHDSPHQQSGTPGQSLRIGWEDGGDQVDGDYNDALVNVTWL